MLFFTTEFKNKKIFVVSENSLDIFYLHFLYR